MNMASTSSSDVPLIMILGSTATGKSKLGIHLAKELDGEIISADSMQVYHGLDIITAKVTKEEQREVPHHMINLISPPQEFTVVQFRDRAMEVIKELQTKKKVPIIVGGTNYYIEALLWDFLVDAREQEGCSVEIASDDSLQERKQIPESFATAQPEETEIVNNPFEELKKVDPTRANQLHPNDVRKISRSLQIFQTTGKPHSDLLEEQKRQDGSSHLSGPLRFSRVLLFWLRCRQDVLDRRISQRMESMVDLGLKKEIQDFYKQHKPQNKSPLDTPNIESKAVIESEAVDVSTKDADVDTSYTEGLFQAIGFKEFHSFITSTEEDVNTLDGLFREGLEKLKRTTIKYSKKQQTWVRNRILSRQNEDLPVYELDVSDLDLWDKEVRAKAITIAKAFVSGATIPYPCMEKVTPLSVEKSTHVCDICDGKIIIGGEAHWQEHLKSKRHRKRTGRKRKFPHGEELSVA